MFEEHDEEFLLDDRGRVVEGEQVGEGVRVVLGLGQQSILVQIRYGPNGLRHQVVGIADHVVAVVELLLGEIRRVALIAGFQHLVALRLPGLLIEASDVGCFHDSEPAGGIAGGIENAEGLQDGGAVGGPLLVLRQGQADGEEAPGGCTS